MKDNTPHPFQPQAATGGKPAHTPAQKALHLAAGPTFLESTGFGPPDSVLAGTIEPDDWRFYYLMRELSQEDRSRILSLTELLFNLRHAQRWSSSKEPAVDGR